MSKIHPADYLIVLGLLLIGIGFHSLYPDLIPYFFLTIGVIMSVLGCLGIVKGIRRV